jgi:hypothetical protein
MPPEKPLLLPIPMEPGPIIGAEGVIVIGLMVMPPLGPAAPMNPGPERLKPGIAAGRLKKLPVPPSRTKNCPSFTENPLWKNGTRWSNAFTRMTRGRLVMTIVCGQQDHRQRSDHPTPNA